MKKLFQTITLTTLLIVGSAVALASVGSYTFETTVAAQASQNNSVSITNFTFSPATMTVQPGTTVTWTNQDDAAHTVTSDSGNELGSNSLRKGQTYSHKFDKAGTYAYHCSIHPQMKATVTVASSTPPAGQQGNTPATPSNPTPAQTPATPAPSSSSQSRTPTPTGGSGAGSSDTVALGAADTGSGSTAGLRHVPAFVSGALALIVAGLLLAMQRRHLMRK